MYESMKGFLSQGSCSLGLQIIEKEDESVLTWKVMEDHPWLALIIRSVTKSLAGNSSTIAEPIDE